MYRIFFNISATAATLTHCKRELFHALWELFLDEDFMHAYEHGILIMFPDGIVRHVFPRIFTYSADYPEK
jgi:Plavaka transposase